MSALDQSSSLLERLRQVPQRNLLEGELHAVLIELGAAAYDRLGVATSAQTVINSESDMPNDSPQVESLPRTVDESVMAKPRFAMVVTQPEPREAIVIAQSTPVPVTPEVLQQLRSRMLAGSSTTPSVRLSVTSTSDPEVRDIVEATCSDFGPTPKTLKGKKPALQELEKIQRVLDAHLDRWHAAGSQTNRQLTSWVTARARAAQDELALLKKPELNDAFADLFRRLTLHSAVTQPGKVTGLSQSHKPPANGWLVQALNHESLLRTMFSNGSLAKAQDEQAARPAVNTDDEIRKLTQDVRAGIDGKTYSERLRYLLSAGASPSDVRIARLSLPFLNDLEGAEFATMRRVIAQQAESDGDASALDGAVHIPEEWPWITNTRGKIACIVGGSPKPERLTRLRDAFGFAELQWLSGSEKRGAALDSLVQKMRHGTVDMVIVLRAFSTHKMSDKVFGLEVSPCARVLADSYGVQQVRLGIERFCTAQSATLTKDRD